MKILEKKNVLFYIGLSMELLFMLVNLGAYAIPSWLNIGRVMQVAGLLFVCKIALTRYSQKEWIVNIILLFFGFASYKATGGDEWVLRVLFMLIASKGIETNRTVKYIFYVTITGVCIIVVCSLLGVGSPLVNIMNYGRGSAAEVRWTFGMGHPNHTHGVFCYLFMLGIYLYHDKIRWMQYIILTVLNVVLFLFTVSRAGFLITQILLCIAFVVTYCRKEFIRKVLFIGGIAAIIGTVLFTIYVGKCGVKGSILTLLDKMLTNRLTQISWYGDPKTWRLLSQSDEIGRATIDVSYGAIINAYGYLVMLAYTVLNILLLVRFYKDDNRIGMVVLLSCILYGMMENYMNAYFLLYNVIFILLIGNWNRLLAFQEKECA